MRKFLSKLKDKIYQFRNEVRCSKCYDQMEKDGTAIFGCCYGVTENDNLPHKCVDCPYLVKTGERYE